MPVHDMVLDRMTLRVPVSLDAPAIARRSFAGHARPLLGAQRLDDAKLLVSEVVTNAVRHAGLSPRDEITLEAAVNDRGLRVEIADPGSGFRPVLRPGSPTTGGWGLPLLELLSESWGVAPRPGGGSVVWFEISTD